MIKPYNKTLYYFGDTHQGRKKAWGRPKNLLNRKINARISSDESVEEKRSEGKRLKKPLYLLNHYIANSSIHGLRYVLDPELYTIERFVWFVFFIASIVATTYAVCIVTAQFQDAPTVTVIESTSYKVSSIPFPAVTICPRDRVDWKKAMQVESEFVPSNNTHSVKLFRKLLTTLSSMAFARFYEVNFLKNTSFTEIAHINVTDVLYKVAPSCKDILSACWWRYDDKECCEIFELQKTEYGFCYSFNSGTSETLRTATKGIQITSGYGDRSGLKFTLHLGKTISPPTQDLIRGGTLLINHPDVWPSSGQAIAAGMSLSVNLRCTSGYATRDVLNLRPEKIPCKYTNSEKIYNQETCISDCRRSHVKKHCNCNPSYYFQTTETRECNVKDFICLIKHNEIFTNYQIPGDTQEIEEDEPIMFCNCPPSCDFYNYMTNIVAIPIDEENDIMLDIHYEGPTSIRYKMEVVLTSLNLLVAFGGIFGLFLGGSILSIVEFIYTCFVGACGRFFQYLKTKRGRRSDSEDLPRVTPRIYTTDFPPIQSNIILH